MKRFSIEPSVAVRYLREFSAVIHGQDDYWIEQNNGPELPKGIVALQKALAKHDSLSALAAEAVRWSKPSLGYQPEPCLFALYSMILDAEQGKFDSVTPALSTLTRAQRQYSELKAKLHANQTTLNQAVQSQNKAMEARAYQERGLLYGDADKIRYARQALACFSQAIELKADASVTAFCLRKRAALYLEQGKSTDALNDLREACKRVDDNPQAWFEYGEALIDLERYEEAVEPLKKALLLRPQHYRTQILLQAAITQGKLPQDALQNIQVLLAVGHTLESLNARAEERNELPLWLKAAQLGDSSVIEYLASQTDTQIRDAAGNTALHYAARLGHVHLIDFLSRHIDLNATNRQGLTPLLIAVQAGKVSMAEGLISAGTHPKGALLMAVETGQGCVFEALQALNLECDSGALLQKAIETKQLPMLKMLLHCFPDALNALYQGETLLHSVIRAQFTEAVHTLIERGIDLESRNRAQKTAEEIANESASPYQFVIQKARAERREVQKKRDGLERALLNGLLMDFPLLKKRNHRMHFLGALNEALSGRMLNQALSRFLVKSLIERKASLMDPCPPHEQFITETLQETLNTLMVSWRMLNAQPQPPSEGFSSVHARFCERFEQQLDEAYGYFNVIASGELISPKDQSLLRPGLTRMLPDAPPGVRVPIASWADSALELASFLRRHYARSQAERMVRIFKAVTPYERVHFIRYVAEQLADKYHAQIQHLMPGFEGVELFADCAAARVIEYLTSSEQSQRTDEPSLFTSLVRSAKSWTLGQAISPQQREPKNLFQWFIEGIIRASSKFQKDRERLKTINNLTPQDNWSARGIFESTGIITADYQRYAHPRLPIERYGYCKGCVEEAQHRGLTLRPKKGAQWGEGRVWESVLDNQAERLMLNAFKSKVVAIDSEKSTTAEQKPAIGLGALS